MISIPDAAANAEKYRAAAPFPHIVLDDFLPTELADELANAFPTFENMATKFNEPMSIKGQTSDIANKAPAFSDVFDELQSDDFRMQIGEITGISDLLADAILAGGGLHQSPKSGHLDLHVDANMHPNDKTMHRRVNILIYLNRGWNEDWGGELQLYSDRGNKPDQRIVSIAPIFNRAVIFSTTRTSWHGVSKIECPLGKSRKSLALYYYTHTRPEAELYADSSVIWQSTTGWKKFAYPVMNAGIAVLKPYAKQLRGLTGRQTFDADKATK